MSKEKRILQTIMIISLFLLFGITYPISSNSGSQEKTIKDRIQEYYSEPIDFSEHLSSGLPQDTVPEGSLEAKLEIDHPPKIGETAHLTLTIISHCDFPKVKVEIDLGRVENVDKEAGIKVVSGLGEFRMSECRHASSYNYTFFCPLKSGENRIFEFDIKVTSQGIKYITGGVGRSPQIIWYRPICAWDEFYLDVTNKVTEISKELFPRPPEYWITPLVQGSGPFWGVKRMREDMEKFMKIAPELTKWEARWLVDKAEWTGREEFTRVHAKRKEEPPSDLELRRQMIKNIINEAQNKAKNEKKSLSKVLKKEVSDWKRKRPKKTWGFREDVQIKEQGSEKRFLDKSLLGRAAIYVKGCFKFKKHLYNKDDGLLEETVDRPIRRALVVVWEHYEGLDYIIKKGITDENGNYDFVCTPVDTTEYWHDVWVVIVTVGPDLVAPEYFKIRVRSHTISQFPAWPTQPWWRDHPDSIATVPLGGTADFDTFYFAEWKTGLYPDVVQPYSGAVNIFDALIRAYEYVADTIGLPLPLYSGAPEAIWEPGYHPIGYYTSSYRDDTIKICGVMEGYGDQRNTDEWDDEVIIHEYAHFLMHRFAELEIGGGGLWHKNYDDDLRGAWEEAWAYLFPCIVIHDTFFANTHHGIGGDAINSYYNLEDENDFWYEGCPDSMEGGGGCIDAIAASLWDFCDATNESWPDGRHDQLTVSFNEIWDVFDNFDPYPPQGNGHDNCWSVHEFWAGYLSLGYNYASWIKEIFQHHKIAGMTGYVFNATGGNQKVDLDWRVKTYKEKDRSTNIFYIYRSDWEFGPFSLLDSVDYVPPETLYYYSDTTVQYAMPYWYKLGIVDSAGLESESEVDSGIPFNLPSAPLPPSPVTDLSAFDTPYDMGGSITLTWTKSAEDSIVTNYYIFRSWYSGKRYCCIDSVGQGIETYVDMNTVDGDTFYYIVRAHNGINGSNSNEVWAISEKNSAGFTYNHLATAFGKKIEISPLGRLHFIWCDSNCIKYNFSDNGGGNWSEIENVGEGSFPSIALDSSGEPNVVWVWCSSPPQPAESRLYFSRNTASGWTTPYELWNNLYTSGVPCFEIDNTDSGKVVWNHYFQFFPNGHSAISFGSFNTQESSPAFNDTLIDDDFVEPGCMNPSIDIDTVNYDNHVVYSKDDDIYYAKITQVGISDTALLSDGTGNSMFPYIDYDENTDSLDVVWQKNIGGIYQIIHSSRHIGTPNWTTPEIVYSSADNSVNPVITGGNYVFWSEEIPGNSEIYYSKFNGVIWEPPVLVKSTPEASAYPQVTHTLGTTTDTVFAAWTDGDSAPYIIEFEKLNIAKTLLISGHITQNTTWDRNVFIVGDVIVDSGITLSINPGITVYFNTTDNQHSGFYPDKAELIVEGSLLAQGVSTDSIRFTSPNEIPGDWGHIRFIGSGTEGSIIGYSRIEYARYGIRCDNASPTVRHSLIQKNAVLGTTAGGGILAFNSSSIIEHNTIIYNGSEATTKSKEPRQTVRKSHSRFFSQKEKNIDRENFEDSLDIGIYARESKLTVIDNYISHNGTWGILAFLEKGGVYEQNTIFNNFHNLHIALGESCEVEIVDNTLTSDSGFISEIGFGIEASFVITPDYRYVKLQAYKNQIIANNQGIAMMIFSIGTPSMFNIDITDNTIQDNYYGSYLWGSDDPSIKVNYSFNTVTNNEIGFWLQGINTTGKNTIVLGDLTNTSVQDDGRNRIHNNKTWNIYYTQDTDTLMAQGNIWDNCDVANIDNTIYDNDEDPNSGPVNFDGFYIWGPITKDVTWSGIISVAGDITVSEDATLTIEPGTEVRFASLYDATHSNFDTELSELIIEGNLEAQGTEDDIISFTSDALEPHAGDWYGIRFVNSKKNNERIGINPLLSKRIIKESRTSAIEEKRETEKNDDTFEDIVKRWIELQDRNRKTISEFSYMSIEYAKKGITYLGQTILRLENTEVRNCSEIGIISEAPLWLKDGSVTECDSVGVLLKGFDGVIWGTQINQNGIGVLASGKSIPNILGVNLNYNKIGIYAEGESKPIVMDSKVIGNNNYGVFITDKSKPNFGGKGHSYIYGSGLFDLYNNTANKIQARRNYWGTMELDSIEAHIWDYYDDNSLGKVEVLPLWDGNQTIAGTMSSGQEDRFIYSLKPVSPNPFVNRTTVAYSIAKPGKVSVKVFDISGRCIKSLVDEKKEAGFYTVKWNGCNSSDKKIAAGVYFTRLTSGDFTSVRKVILVR